MSRQDKKAQFQQATKRRTLWPILIAVLIIAGAAGAWVLFSGGLSQSQLQVDNGIVRIPQSAFADGTARFYKVQSSRGEIGFFLVKSPDGVIRAAFDTCDVCYQEKKGYRQEGDFMVCNNCDQKFRTDLINVVKGGCNPAPLQRELQGDQVVIRLAALEEGSWYFNGHPQ
jgi:uncharacterized membrane protein